MGWNEFKYGCADRGEQAGLKAKLWTIPNISHRPDLVPFVLLLEPYVILFQRPYGPECGSISLFPPSSSLNHAWPIFSRNL